MKVISWLSFLLATLLTTTQALVIVDSTIASSCLYYENQFNWGCAKKTGHSGSYACYCVTPNWLQSVTNCIYNATTEQHLREHAFRHVIGRCKTKGHVHLTMKEMHHYQENGTNYFVEFSLLATTYPVNGTLKWNETDFKWFHSKFKEYTVFVQRSQWFGWGLVFYWAFIIGMATLFNINKRMLGWRFLNRYNNVLNKTLLIPSMFSNYHDRTFILWRCIPFDFPTRAHAIVMTIFIIITMIFVGIGYNVTLPHPYLTTRWYANLVLVSYRTDLMSLSIFPMIYFFGIRNNPFMYLTGFSYTTFNYYHRWCAYICTILAFIHSIIWTVWAVYQGPYSTWAKDDYWRWGIAATTLMFLLIFHSERVIRNWAYEVFLLIHLFMSVAFIICMYYHLIVLGWMGWVWAMVAIHSYDRFMRLVRIGLHGGIVNANLKDCGNGIIKMTIKKPRFFNYQAGSFAYVYFFSSTSAWFYNYQSHPFTVLNDPTEDPKDPKTIVFYFRAHKGVTRTILYRILSSGEESVNCKIMLEGPYGAQLPQLVKSESNIIGIAAGLGISAVYPHLYKTLKQVTEIDSEYKHKLVWIIRDMNYLNWFAKELNWLRSKGCDVKIVVTSFDKESFNFDTESSSKSFTEKATDCKEELYIEKLGAKPNLYEIVGSEIATSESVNKNINFVGCGPELFNDDLRAAVATQIPKISNINVEFQSESFVW
ncbi:ferric/cupric reductase transmembrane component 1 [Monosporozyma unispora]|nr:hypothetical protein C6P44_003394 [Kazachstania unispora]